MLKVKHDSVLTSVGSSILKYRSLGNQDSHYLRIRFRFLVIFETIDTKTFIGS